MGKNVFQVAVSIDARMFRDFALFDSFVRQRRFRPLALFAGILLLSACICFIAGSRVEQAFFLGGVLLLVGLGLPAVYIISFLSSVRQQIKKMRLTNSRHAYTLTISKDEGIYVEAGKEKLAYRWEDIFGVYRVQKAAYLFVHQNKAYLLPDMQVEGGAEGLWKLFESMVPSDRIFDKRRFGIPFKK